MGNRPDPRKRGNDEETRARKEKAGTSERDVLRWQPPQLRELTSNEKSRPRRSKLGKRRFLKADRVDGKFFALRTIFAGNKRKHGRVCYLLTLLYNIYLFNDKTVCGWLIILQRYNNIVCLYNFFKT